MTSSAAAFGSSLPPLWSDVVEAGPHVIHLSRDKERLSALEEQQARCRSLRNLRWEEAVEYVPGENECLDLSAFAFASGVRWMGWEGKAAERALPSGGHRACALSHFRLWKRVVDENLPFLWICEDDVLFSEDFDTLAESYYAHTPTDDLDVLLLGRMTAFPEERQEVRRRGDSFVHVSQRPSLGTFSYILTQRGARHLVDLVRHVGLWTIDRVVHFAMAVPSLVRGVWHVDMYMEEFMWLLSQQEDGEALWQALHSSPSVVAFRGFVWHHTPRRGFPGLPYRPAVWTWDGLVTQNGAFPSSTDAQIEKAP